MGLTGRHFWLSAGRIPEAHHGEEVLARVPVVGRLLTPSESA